MEIIIIRVVREDGGFRAFVESEPKHRGEGKTKAEAIGDLIMIWQTALKGIKVIW